jgi:hypothetical protein
MLLSGFTATESNSTFEESPEKLRAVIATLLNSEIEKAVDEFYEPYLHTQPVTDVNYTDITSVVIGDNGARFTIVAEVTPYVGPHCDVGRDRLTFSIDTTGCIETVSFDHLSSSDLPEHLQSLIKKPLPNSIC